MTQKKENNFKKSAKTSKAKSDVLSQANVNNVVEDSLKMVKSIKTEVDNMHKLKDSLKSDIVKLNERISEQEKNTQSKTSNDKLCALLKDEILKDFAPLIKKFDLKKIKSDIFSEINQIIELEFSKLKFELDSQTVKDQKNFTKKISDLEVKVFQSVSENKKVKEELQKSNQHVSFTEQIEEKINERVSKANEKYFVMLDANTLELNELRKKSDLLQKRIDNIRGLMQKSLSKEDLDLTSLDAKIKQLSDENVSIKSLLERYEDDLYNKSKKESLEIENKVKKKLLVVEEKLKILSTEKLEQQKFMQKRVNEIDKFIEIVEKKLKQLDKVSLSKVEENLIGMLDEKISILESRIEEFNNKIQRVSEVDSEQMLQLKEELVAQFDDIKARFVEFDQKNEGVRELVQKEFEMQIGDMKTLEASYEQNIQKILEGFKGQVFAEVTQKLVDSQEGTKKDVGTVLDEILMHKKEILEQVENKFNDVSAEYSAKVLEVQEYLKNIAKDTENLHDSFELEKEAQDRFLMDKFNETIINLETITNEKFQEARSLVEENFANLVEVKMKEIQAGFENDKKGLENDFVQYKQEIAKLQNKNVVALDKKINSINDGKEEVHGLILEVKEEVASQIALSNEQLTKINLEAKESIQMIAESLEAKFLNVKEQIDAEFNSQIIVFNDKIATKEKEIFEKFQIIDADKEVMINELTQFKLDIEIETKKQIENLEQEMQKLRVAEFNFEDEKQAYLTYISEITSEKKNDLQKYGELVGDKLYDLIRDKTEEYEYNENSFRLLFTEKVQTLHDLISKELETIRKSFIDKNLKVVTDKLALEMKVFKLYEERLTSKEEELDKKVDLINAGHENFFSELDAERKKLSEKVEERLITLEKHFNKRFLNYDTSFSTFKGVIVDEVEGFMRDITQITNDRIENADTTLAKLATMSAEIKEEFEELKKLKTTFSEDLGALKSQIYDTKEKLVLFQDFGLHSLKDHVHYMSEYEVQLVGLIKSLKKKGVSDEKIKTALHSKGHPMFYVSMILMHLNEIYS